MKKIYIKPSILLTKMAFQQMICESQPGVGISSSGSVDAGEVESRSGFWDDDDED